MDSLDNYLKAAVQSAKEAGVYLIEHFQEDHSPVYKSDFDVALNADKESERIILARISNAFPSHNIYSEEIGTVKNKSDFTWYVDPLDGTNNYFVGIPYFGISIALLNKGETILGVVYNPITEQIFTAIKDRGAFLNGVKISLKHKSQSPYSVLAFIKGHEKNNKKDSDEKVKEVEKVLTNNFSRVLKMWAPSLDWSLLALGKITALVSYESELEDMFAGLLLAQEAGVEVCGFDGAVYQEGVRKIIASNKHLVNNLIRLLNNCL